MADLHPKDASYAASAQKTGSPGPVLINREHASKLVGRQSRGSKRGFSKRSIAMFVVAVLTFVVLAAPSPYVVETPGPTQDVLGSSNGKQVIAISGTQVYETKNGGKLLLTTVNAAGIPGAPVSGLETLINWVNPHATVLPKEVIFPPGQSREQYLEDNKKDMTGSQDSATTQALKFLEGKGTDTSGIKVNMHVDDIGGPSAGLMYALGTIDKLTEQDETGGQVIAGTGTMEEGGKVGRIGGIQLKMLGAKRDGATWFLAPAGNCGEVVGHVPEGLRDVRVTTLSDAYEALTKISQNEADTLPHCTASKTTTE
ncbi:Lon protease [Bombiscardovia apis]|uniref:Lon protease n=1 Tax=Bombiscardovia apis TaxID=2932182 RepID=A0ABM8BBT9_9BIFI|nr:S16 family serine protease [Bombiscardovia apis]BDR54349.1 Lon protease [Bombiscardovia apis]